ncbi:gdsl esterase/lipase [Quercus suber]|uniref:Gdsl esterase/lipase n=1 Tax=Quercus suber TaxID=58331 RepID=A0AAW0LDD8_QUESU
MAGQMKKILLLLLVVLFLVLNLQHCVDGMQQVPCFFIFGDSLSDNGNNNNLVTKAKANYQPYGIDFPEGPTGRFTNGRNLVDIIGRWKISRTCDTGLENGDRCQLGNKSIDKLRCFVVHGEYAFYPIGFQQLHYL